MKTHDTQRQAGFVSGAMVASIVLGILTLIFGSIMIWALVNYNDQANNTKSKVAAAVSEAIDVQKSKDQKNFDEKEKEPLKEFVGPTDLGRVTFSYPKTWSVYVASDGSKNTDYMAYFHPGIVPSTITETSKFALQVSVVGQPYEQVLQQYSSLVKQGQLRSQAITANGYKGQKLEGNLTQTVEGSVAVFKIRDKTLILKTYAPDFRPDFDGKILTSLSFDQ